MRTSLAVLAAASILAGVAGVGPTGAAPIRDPGLVQAGEGLSNYTEVRSRRYVRRYHRAWPRRYYANRYPYLGPSAYPYYATRYYDGYYYPYFPHYYAPGPFISIGFGGFGIGYW